jgi:hypothetical protein
LTLRRLGGREPFKPCSAQLTQLLGQVVFLSTTDGRRFNTHMCAKTATGRSTKTRTVPWQTRARRTLGVQMMSPRNCLGDLLPEFYLSCLDSDEDQNACFKLSSLYVMKVKQTRETPADEVINGGGHTHVQFAE